MELGLQRKKEVDNRKLKHISGKISAENRLANLNVDSIVSRLLNNEEMINDIFLGFHKDEKSLGFPRSSPALIDTIESIESQNLFPLQKILEETRNKKRARESDLKLTEYNDTNSKKYKNVLEQIKQAKLELEQKEKQKIIDQQNQQKEKEKQSLQNFRNVLNEIKQISELKRNKIK